MLTPLLHDPLAPPLQLPQRTQVVLPLRECLLQPRVRRLPLCRSLLAGVLLAWLLMLLLMLLLHSTSRLLD